MKVVSRMMEDQVGRYIIVKEGDQFIPYRIASVGCGQCGWMVLEDDSMLLRGGNGRHMLYNENQEFTTYDTADEAMSSMKE